MSIVMLVAKDVNGAIGKDNKLAWKLPSDLKRFSWRTKGGIVIMGRKTWESLPNSQRPLNKRVNIVVTTQKDYVAVGAVVVNTLEEALEYALESASKLPTNKRGILNTDPDRVFIIGGGQMYQQAMNISIVDKIIATEIDSLEVDSPDTYFPIIDPEHWRVVRHQTYSYTDEHPYHEVIYRRQTRNKR